MSTIYFSIANIFSIKLISDSEFSFGDKEKILFQARIPGIIFLDAETQDSVLFIEHYESVDRKFERVGNSCILFDTWNGVIPEDVYHLLYRMVRVELLKKNLYPIHSICVGLDEYVLVVGHSRSGKSSILLHLLKQGGIQIFSADKTITSIVDGKITGLGGTKTLTIRSQDKDKLNLEIMKNKDSSGDRTVFTLDTNKYTTNQNVPIKAIVLAKLNDNISELKKEKPLSALHNLYPYFLDVVNADVILNEMNELFIGTPPTGSEEYLVTNLKESLRTVPVYSITGSGEFVANHIRNL